MGKDWEEFWSTVPEKAVHHSGREAILEALWWIGEPLSPIDLVDVLDGFLTMWEVAYHLRVLKKSGAVEPISGEQLPKKRQRGFELPFQLKGGAGEDG